MRKIFDSTEYIELVMEELQEQQHKFENQELESLYLGGGTPSLLNDEQIDKICSFFSKINTSFKETSIEIHPTNINFDIVNNPYFTRYSVGIQSLEKSILSKYNRGYNKSTISSLLKKIRTRPNTTLNVDFVFQSNFNTELLSEIIKYFPDSITVYPDTRGRGIERLSNVYDTFDQLRSFFASIGGYKELGHSGYIYISNKSSQSRYSKVQNEFLGNIIGIGDNAISDINDKSVLSLYDLENKKITYKERYGSDRLIKSLITSAAVGITKRMISMVMPNLLDTGLLYTLDNRSISEKHVILNDDELIYIPEYNYNLFFDFLLNQYGKKYALMFLNYISHFDSNLSAEEFFNYFNFRINKNFCLDGSENTIYTKKAIPSVRILIEGIDGSGKDTFAALLANSLKNRFYLEPGRSISIVGQPLSRLSRGEEAKRFIEERVFDGSEKEIIEVLTKNRIYSEKEFLTKKGILMCIRGLLTDLATLKATFNKEYDSLLGLTNKYDYAFIIAIDPDVAYDRIMKRNAPKQWRESVKWLKFFQQYYQNYPLEQISNKNRIIYNNDLKELQTIADEIANEIYTSW